MPVQTNPAPVVAPVTPVRTDPAPDAWPQRFTDPIEICPQQKRELGSPDVEP